ncbi:MAG: hypothetical protein ACO31G_03870 [Ilumatobacteraceae bacterium]
MIAIESPCGSLAVIVTVTGTEVFDPDLQTGTSPEGLVAIVTVGAVLFVPGLFGTELESSGDELSGVWLQPPG